MAGALVRLASFGTLYEAQRARGLLAEAGVESALFGENTVGAFGGTSALLPDVELHVAAADLKRALDVLRDADDARPEDGWERDPAIDDGLWLCPTCDEAVSDDDPECPYCATRRP